MTQIGKANMVATFEMTRGHRDWYRKGSPIRSQTMTSLTKHESKLRSYLIIHVIAYHIILFFLALGAEHRFRCRRRFLLGRMG